MISKIMNIQKEGGLAMPIIKDKYMVHCPACHSNSGYEYNPEDMKINIDIIDIPARCINCDLELVLGYSLSTVETECYKGHYKNKFNTPCK